MAIDDEELSQIRRWLRHELQEDLSVWFRVRFWGAAIIVATVSFFGVRGIVQQVFEGELRVARDETRGIIVEAATATALAKAAADEARLAAEGVERDIRLVKQELEETRALIERQAALLQEVESRAANVDVSFQKIELRIASVRSGAQTLTQGPIDAVLARVAAVEKRLAGFAEESGSSTSAAELAETSRSESEATSTRLKTLESRSAYAVYLFLSDAPEDRIEELVGIIDRNEFPIANLEYLGDPEMNYGFLLEEPLMEIDNIPVGEVVFSISPEMPREFHAWIGDLKGVIEEQSDFSVTIVPDSSTGDAGVNVGIRPQP